MRKNMQFVLVISANERQLLVVFRDGAVAMHKNELSDSDMVD